MKTNTHIETLPVVVPPHVQMFGPCAVKVKILESAGERIMVTESYIH